MEEKGDDPSVLPNIAPERFELADIMVDETPRQRNYTAFYKDGDKSFKITVLSYLEERPEQQEQSEDVSELYEKNGNLYYILSNYDQSRATWIDGAYECYISGDVTIEEIKLMIDSIEKG